MANMLNDVLEVNKLISFIIYTYLNISTDWIRSYRVGVKYGQ